ncbi:UPF0182 family protein [Nocardioides caldifontis]|uniref:UPF0182 family protein n=1 Tax=Nocardioides caldifontis TaxID=2588938 RepID=UPI001396BBCE|nr:UPF0182 family protein [Nocardioides caldifontis]
MERELSVAEVADALGTSAQTVRTLLRKGELGGERRPWGARSVWVVPESALDAFLAEFGRLDGRRRDARPAPSSPPVLVPVPGLPHPGPQLNDPLPVPKPDPFDEPSGWVLSQMLAGPSASESVDEDARTRIDGEAPTARERPRRRLPWFLRVRGRATVVVLVVGVPLLAAYFYARLVPGALWFQELGQLQLFRRVLEAQVELHLRVLVAVSVVVGVNLAVACRGSALTRRPGGVLGIAAAALVVGTLFASATAGALQRYLLWQHRQPFGEVDPIHGKDVGFFVFSLPFLLTLSVWLLTLLAITFALVTLVHRVRGAVGFRPLRARTGAHAHLAVLAAAFLVVLAWRFRLEQYRLELRQPGPTRTESFAGAGYVEVHVTSPLLTGGIVAVLVLAVICLLSPLVARTRLARLGRLVVGGGVVGAAAAGVLALTLVPHLVQRYVVDPDPLLSEEPYLEWSIAGTRAALGLDEVDVQRYDPGSEFDAADFAESRQRFERLPAWDGYVIGARMRQLVTEPPYFSPADPVPDVVQTRKGPELTLVSARELDLARVPDQGNEWVSDRLSYTHGLGLVRFSSNDVGAHRQPRLMDSGLDVPEPRLYFGDLPSPAPEDPVGREVRLLTPTLDEAVADSQWVVANTRRPEVDIPTTAGGDDEPYHYDGDGGIALSSWPRRAIFALALGSIDLLLSDEITTESRLLLHRDVHDRLETLAPFIHWDAEAVPLTADDRVLFVVDGYTTSDHYPYAERVALGDARVSYARASVLATVDAFTGAVELYVTDEDEPVLRAWREVFPDLFTPFEALPDELDGRLRYPAELFHAQSTAYERFHTTRPDVFVSGADTWARPLALSGPIEVAGDIDFDESDEDDLRLTMPPIYIWVPPPDEEDPRLVLTTYYSPQRGQNLVGTLNGWVDGSGRARLVARALPREPVTLGPAQVSRLVFATPRVSNLLGLRNLEIRDLDKSSIDAVMLGRPRVMFLPGGIVQVQSLYEGSRGPGAARLLGVTAFVNGRAGLGPDVPSAVRQALNEPPYVEVLRPDEPLVVGRPAEIAFRVDNARRETVTITSAHHRVRSTLRLESGRGTVTWVPTRAGTARVRVTVAGLDGTSTSAFAAIEVQGPPPRLRLVDRPQTAEVGRPLRVRFDVANGVHEIAEVVTRSGIAFTRHFEIQDGRGVVEWVPESTGTARLVLEVRGTDGWVVRRGLTVEVGPRRVVTPPTLTVTSSPRRGTVGEPVAVQFFAEGCRAGTAALSDDGGELLQEWRFACTGDPAEITWTPTTAGEVVLTVVARGDAGVTQTSVTVRVREPS